MEFFNEETIAYYGNHVSFRESVSRNFSKSTLVAFTIFLYSSLQDDITRTASPKSSPYSSSSSIDFEQLPEMSEEEEYPISFAFAYDYSETTQLRRRVLVVVWYFPSSVTFRRVFEHVWMCLNAFECVWMCLNVFEHATASCIQAQFAWNYVISQERDFAVIKRIAKICWMNR